MDNRSYLIGQYEKSMPNSLSIKDKLLISKELGFDYLELSIDETDEKLQRLDWTEEEIAELYNYMNSIDYYIKSICLSGHRKYPFGSHDENVRKKSLIIMEKAIVLASKLGVRNIQLAGYDVYYEESDESTINNFLSGLKVACNLASKYGVMLGFETMETPFMDTVEKSMKYVNEIKSPYLNVYPDTGNLTNASKLYKHDVIDDILKGRGHIIAAHLKETKPGVYRDMDFFTGHVDFETAIEKYKELGVNMYVLEFWKKDDNWKEIAAKSIKDFRELFKRIYS